MIPSIRRPALFGILTVAFLLSALLTVPAHASGTGILGVDLTGRYTGGHTSPLTGASVTAENLDTGAQTTLSVFGDPAASAYYQALDLPYGRYRVRVERPGFATLYWPRQFSRESAGTVVFGSNPQCNPLDGAACPEHLWSAEVPQLVSLTGSVRHRSGASVPGVLVTATHAEESTFRPAVVTNLNGEFSVQVPAGGYMLSTPNGNSTVTASVQVTGPIVRDLTLLDPPSAPQGVVAATGNRQATVSWSRPLDDGGSPITSFTVSAIPGSAICTTDTLGCTVTGLENGQDYRFSVTAENKVGRSAPSLGSGSVAPTTSLPRPVANVRLMPGDRSIDVTWSASPSDDVLEYTSVATPGGRSCSTAGLACTIPGLRNGTAYSVAVTARSQSGSSPAVVSAKRATPMAAPSAPRNVRVKPKPSALRVAWNAPMDDGGKKIATYVATAWPGGKTCATEGVTTCLIRALDPGTDYSVTVRATNVGGAGATSPGSTPTRPRAGAAAPRRVAKLRVKVAKSQATLRWKVAKGAKSYLVRLTRPGHESGTWMVVRRPVAQFAVTRGMHTAQVKAAGSGGTGAIRQRTFRVG